MNRLAMVCLLLSYLFFVEGATAQVTTSAGTPEGATTADLIAQVKSTSASKFDRRLPDVALADWLQTQAGPGGRISWVFRVAGLNAPNSREFPNCVEADATLKDGRSFFILVDVSGAGHHPRVHETNVVTSNKEMAEVSRLSDLPSELRRSSQNPNRSEGQR